MTTKTRKLVETWSKKAETMEGNFRIEVETEPQVWVTVGRYATQATANNMKRAAHWTFDTEMVRVK